MKELLAILATLAAGPLVFYILSRYKYRTKPSFPVGIIDKYGDVIILPIFNALAVHYGILGLIDAKPTYLLIAFGAAYIMTRIFVIWRKNFAKHDDWSRPERGRFNAGGWYHAFFMLCQLFFIVITMMYFYGRWMLWLPLLALAVLIILEGSHHGLRS